MWSLPNKVWWCHKSKKNATHGVSESAVMAMLSLTLLALNNTCFSNTDLPSGRKGPLPLRLHDWVSLAVTSYVRSAIALETFCIHGADLLRACQATQTPVIPPSYSHLHNEVWVSCTFCIGCPHEEQLSSVALRMMHRCRFPKATAARSQKPYMNFRIWLLSLPWGWILQSDQILTWISKMIMFLQEMSLPGPLLTLHCPAFH